AGPDGRFRQRRASALAARPIAARRDVSASIFVIGAGSWGTALAQAARLAGNRVTLVARDANTVDEINSRHTLNTYLGDIALDPDLFAQTGFSGLEQADAILLVVPAQASRATLAAIGPER